MVAQVDTLRYQLKHRPGTQYRNVSGAFVQDTVGCISTFINNCTPTKVKPEKSAITFYLMNHACSMVSSIKDLNEPLGDYLQLIDRYQNMLSYESVRMFYYLLLICTRESRHVHTDYDWISAEKKYGKKCTAFTKGIRGCGSSDAVSRFKKNPPKVELGKYTRHLVDVFYKGSFSSGYGGHAWGAVADVLNKFVHGELSAELMMDTAFTLCHNNGPIFNKGMLFTGYNKKEIVRILDVQRSGQIPQYVDSVYSSVVDSDHVAYHSIAKKLLGLDFGGYVDWHRVESLGSMQSYPTEKDKQDKEDKKYGKIESYKEKPAIKKPFLSKKSKTTDEAGKSVYEKKYFHIMPGVKVKKIAVRVSE